MKKWQKNIYSGMILVRLAQNGAPKFFYVSFTSTNT